MAKSPSTARRLESGDFEDENVKRLFFGEEPQDEIDWIESFLTIDSEKGTVVDFKLYPQQIKMAHNKTGRDLTVKGRQTRASSYILAKNLRRMFTNWGLKCLVMTQDDQTTATFRARIQHHLKDLAQKGFPCEYSDSKDELVFKETECRYMWGSGQERTAGRAYCVTPETRVLTGDLRWVPAGELAVGEEILGFDEEPRPYRGEGRPVRCYKQAYVTATERRRLPVYEIELETGETLRATDEHRWLVEPTSRNGASWRRTDELAKAHFPQYLLRYLPTWEYRHDWDAGLLSGAFDADGSISRGDGSSPLARFTQYQNPFLAQVQASLSAYGFWHAFREGKGTSEPQYNVVVQGGYAETLRFLGSIRPARLLKNWKRLDLSHRMLSRIQKVLVKSVRYVGEQEVVALSSSSQTYFAEGFASHNTGHIVHLSEFAHWPQEQAKDLIGGITPSVPGPPAGWMDIESTPNGAEGKFYDMVLDSKLYNPQSRWSTHFYPWWLEPRYRSGTTPGCDILYPEAEWETLLQNYRPTAEEEALVDLAQLDVGQVLWRRVRKSEQDKTNAPFLQEYVETLDGCFLTASGSYFATPDGINHLEQYRQTIKPPKEIVESVPGSSVGFSGAGLHVWQRPQFGTPYAVWVDCAGGGLEASADYTAIVVMDTAHMFIAARLCIKAAPHEVAPMAVAIAQYYNKALLGGERDAFGLTCVQKIQEIGYRNLWYFIEPGQAMSIHKAVEQPWGHPTQMRQHILNALRAKVFSGLFHTSDGWGVQQMGAFTWSKVAQKRYGLKEAGKGQKDDLVMAYAGLCYIAPIASSRYNTKQRVTTGPIQDDETVTVGKFGLVVDRRSGGNAPRPWLK